MRIWLCNYFFLMMKWFIVYCIGLLQLEALDGFLTSTECWQECHRSTTSELKESKKLSGSMHHPTGDKHHLLCVG